MEIVDPEATGCRHIDIALHVSLHAVRHACATFFLYATGKDAPVDQASVSRNIKHADVGLIRVVHPHPAPAGCQAQAIGLREHVAIADELWLVSRTVVWRQAIDALKTQLQVAWNAKAFHAPVSRVGEVDPAIIRDTQVIG